METHQITKLSKPTQCGANLAQTVYESPKTVRRRGQVFRLCREAEAMNYMQNHTSIPIPAILVVHFRADDDEELSWFLMKRPPWSQLGDAWPTMSEGAQAQMILQLKPYLEQLHRLCPPDSGWIRSFSNGPACDHRLINLSTCGPFAPVGEFHDFLERDTDRYELEML